MRHVGPRHVVLAARAVLRGREPDAAVRGVAAGAPDGRLPPVQGAARVVGRLAQAVEGVDEAVSSVVVQPAGGVGGAVLGAVHVVAGLGQVLRVQLLLQGPLLADGQRGSVGPAVGRGS